MINYLYSEKMCPKLFDKNPIQDLSIKVKDHADISKKYLNGIDFEDSEQFYSEIIKAFPESTDQIRERT